MIETNLIKRRTELLAEAFLQELKPLFFIRTTTEHFHFPFDFLLTFDRKDSGLKLIAVAVKAARTRSGGPCLLMLPEKDFRRISNANIPVLLLAVDPKTTGIYYLWGDSIDKRNISVQGDYARINISGDPVNEAGKSKLLAEILK